MINHNQYRDQFLKAQVGVGITRANFTKKFLFTPQGQQDNYLLDRYTPSPSQLQGFTIQQQKCMGYLMSEMIFRAGESLKLPVSTTIVATAISHYFYSRVGYLDFDFRDVIMGAMFLACKSEETLRKSYEISSVFDYIFKIFQGQRTPIKVQILNSQEYEYMRKKVIEMENHILFQEGFEIFRLFDIPHRYIGGLFKTFDRHPDCKKICQRAWIYLNDLYKTNCVLFYPGQAIAAAAVYMSLLKLNIKMPTVPWWILMQSNLQIIEQLIGQLESFYDASSAHKYSLEWVATQINELADKHKLVNVFPVNYYRKINLDMHAQLKIPKIIIQIPKVQIPTSKADPKEEPKEQSKRSPSRQHSRGQRKKKKKEKSKKQKKEKKKKDKKKHHSNDSRDRSKSLSRIRSRKNSQSSDQNLHKGDLSIRNNDQTPKVSKKQQTVIAQATEIKNQTKQAVKQMQVGNAKGLLSLISNQLKMRQTKKQQNDPIQPIQHSQPPQKSRKDQSQDDSDEQLLAQLIEIKKNKKLKQEQS